MSEGKGLKLTGLWAHEKDGKRYWSGRLGNARVMVFPNTNKRNPKAPDADLVLYPYEPRPGDKTETPEDTGVGASYEASGGPTPEPGTDTPPEDPIPF